MSLLYYIHFIIIIFFLHFFTVSPYTELFRQNTWVQTFGHFVNGGSSSSESRSHVTSASSSGFHRTLLVKPPRKRLEKVAACLGLTLNVVEIATTSSEQPVWSSPLVSLQILIKATDKLLTEAPPHSFWINKSLVDCVKCETFTWTLLNCFFIFYWGVLDPALFTFMYAKLWK